MAAHNCNIDPALLCRLEPETAYQRGVREDWCAARGLALPVPVTQQKRKTRQHKLRTKPDPDPDILTAEEAAPILKVSPQWVYAHATGRRRPKLPSKKIGGARRFMRPEILAFRDNPPEE